MRRVPVLHRFRYPLYMVGVDHAELDELSRCIPLLGYNRPALVALHDRDYLDGTAVPIRARLEALLLDHGIDARADRMMLVTMPRFMHVAFNPVSFHYGFDSADQVRWIVAEVNNTSGERHLYLLDTLSRQADGRLASAEVPKRFHVSPFLDMNGHYRFLMPDLKGDLDVEIDLVREGESVLQARLEGEARPFTGRELQRTVLRHPLDTVMTLPRIIAQAAVLKLKRRLPVHVRPPAESPMTIRRSS